MEHHHISTKALVESRCIDIYLDHEKGIVKINDALKKSNRIVISGSDWNELVNRIKTDIIGKIAE